MSVGNNLGIQQCFFLQAQCPSCGPTNGLCKPSGVKLVFFVVESSWELRVCVGAVWKSAGGGHLSIQSGDISYEVGESDVDILLSRDSADGGHQSATSSAHDATAQQQVSRKPRQVC